MVDLPLPVGPVTRKMPCGSDVKCSMRRSMWSSKPRRSEVVEIAGGAVEQAHDDAFAVERRERGDAEVDFAADGLDFDAAVLRQAAFGDVELRHQLDAGDDGGLHFARRRFLRVQDAVDAVADAELLFERLDVDVAGALLDGLGDHGVDEPDDGRLAGHVAQVFEIFVGRSGFVAGAVGFGALGLAVVAVDGIEDFLLGGERPVPP